VRILIVAWSWPPIGRIGALRPLGMAREWANAGHEVHVLTGPGDRGGEYTPDLIQAASESGALVHRASAPAIPPPADLRAAFEMDPADLVERSTISRWRQIASQWKHFPDLQRSWIRPGIALARQLAASHRFDVVWSTSPPESVNFIARAVARQGVPWVADFRDPWSDYALSRWDPLSRWVIDRITKRLLSEAAAITTNVEGCGASLRRATGREIVCVRNGFDPVIQSHRNVRERTLGYFGRVYPRLHRPDRLWNALRTLRHRGRPWTVEFYTSPGGSGGALIDVPSDLTEHVRILRPMPREAALHAMQEMAALLVLALEPESGDPSVPGKLFDYIGSGRPILVSAPSHFEMRRFVESRTLGLGGWGDAETLDALENIGGFEVDRDQRALLTRANSADALLKVFSRVLAQRAGVGPGRIDSQLSSPVNPDITVSR